MKKLLIVMMMILLTACGSKLEKMGYNQKDLEIINSLSLENQKLFEEEYNLELVNIINNSLFKEENLSLYQKYYAYFDLDNLMYLVNEGIVNDDNYLKLQSLFSCEYYIAKNHDLYLAHLDDYADVRDLVEVVNTKRYLPEYTDIKETDMSKGNLILVNKYYALASDYEPLDLVEIAQEYGKGYLKEETYNAYVELANDAFSNGYDLVAVSAYRSYDTQYDLYHYYLTIDPQDVVDSYSARPGHSEHQSGLCVDVSVPGYSLDDFYLTEASVWLKDNCYKYGFIIRYTEEKKDITAYQAEPWQIRFVGKEVALDILEKGITFDEYYACYVED